MTILPDLVFVRDFNAEGDGGYVLAGRLGTDIPKLYRKPSRKHLRLIRLAIENLVAALKGEPDLAQAGMWREGQKPADGASPPFDVALMKARCQRCVAVDVRVLSGGQIEITAARV